MYRKRFNMKNREAFYVSPLRTAHVYVRGVFQKYAERYYIYYAIAASSMIIPDMLDLYLLYTSISKDFYPPIP